MAKTLVIASHNEGKVSEIRALIQPLGIQVMSAAEKNIPEPEETGKTFVANAELKARHAAEVSGLPSLADDSGLAVPALDGAPGIYSARWAGPKKDFAAAFLRIQTELAAKSAPQNSPAYFVCVLSLALPGGAVHSFEGRVDGSLTFPPRGAHGFGYDPIFTPENHRITFGEMLPDDKHLISHRARAFEKFLAFLKNSESIL